MTISPVNVPTLIKDLQRIVVELRESDQVNLSLTYAHRVADIIQRRGGDTPSRHVPGQDTETEHKESRNRQLRDLDNENRQLRQLYEDSQWTLHLVMEAHRKELDSHFGQHESTPLPGSQNDDDVESLKNRFHKSVALMARDVNEVFRHEQRINEAFSKRIEDLALENEVLRCVLESQSEESADAVIERLERRLEYLFDMEWESNEVRSEPCAVLSSLCDGLSHEERRKTLSRHIDGIQKHCCDTFAKLEKTKSSIEEARVKYENMNDMIRTLEQLRCSLEQHIRMVRLNESSFGGASSVLEYDSAKSRTNNLINVIKARSQWDRAMEYLQEEGRDDQQKMYECLADMQNSQETLANFLTNGFDTKEFEEVKDRFLAWQSTALIFAIQQADFDKLTEIQQTYESLGRKDEFISIFRRVSINRLREFKAEFSSVQLIIDALYKELEFVFTHHHKVLRRFLNDDAASNVLSEAIQQGLSEINLTESFANLLSSDENPIESLQKVSQFLASRSDASMPGLNTISQQLKAKIIQDLVDPFRSALLSYILSKINALDLNSGSFRARVESLKTAIAELLHLLTDVFVHSEALFGHDVKNVVQQPIDKGLENFLAKLKSWEYWLDSQRRQRSLEDIITVCSASGQLVYGLQEFKAMVTNVEPSLSPNIKSALKWNRGVCDNVIKTANDKVVLKMKAKMEEIKTTVTKGPPMSNLPAFSTPPHEYITTVGQELLQLFHLWEQFFLDDNVVHSFYIALKKKFEGDDLFKKTVSDVANNVITEFVSSIGDPGTLSKEVARQFHADTVFLKDAFEDLRTGNVEQLTALEAQLESRYAQ